MLFDLLFESYILYVQEVLSLQVKNRCARKDQSLLFESYILYVQEVLSLKVKNRDYIVPLFAVLRAVLLLLLLLSSHLCSTDARTF